MVRHKKEIRLLQYYGLSKVGFLNSKISKCDQKKICYNPETQDYLVFLVSAYGSLGSLDHSNKSIKIGENFNSKNILFLYGYCTS